MNLYCRTEGNNFKFAKQFKNYHDAIHAGQELAGYGNFYIETERPPTREQQLLLPPIGEVKFSKKQAIIDAI